MAVPQWRTNVSTSDRVVECIYGVLDEFNQELPLGLKLSKSTETVLYGEAGQLDSINLVHLIVAVEERVETEFGVAVTLADERAMSMRNSPFATVSSLSAYVCSLLESEEGVA
jgi:acyl carrier protein